jgi:N-acetylmuramic acid 6-phosphate etherase
VLRRASRPTRTEQRNPRSRGLDRKSAIEIVRVLNREDARVAQAVRRELMSIAGAVEAIVKGFRAGGKLFYVGAGTSGRLATLDAAECPPTFGTSPARIHTIVAGGARALRFAVEGAEDSAPSGARDLAQAGVGRRDVVVGISASGATPYVLGALKMARGRGDTPSPAPRPHNNWRHFESPLADCSVVAHLDRRGGRPRGRRRFNASESWHGAENGSEHALHSCDGTARQGL